MHRQLAENIGQDFSKNSTSVLEMLIFILATSHAVAQPFNAFSFNALYVKNFQKLKKCFSQNHKNKNLLLY